MQREVQQYHLAKLVEQADDLRGYSGGKCAVDTSVQCVLYHVGLLCVLQESQILLLVEQVDHICDGGLEFLWHDRL